MRLKSWVKTLLVVWTVLDYTLIAILLYMIRISEL